MTGSSSAKSIGGTLLSIVGFIGAWLLAGFVRGFLIGLGISPLLGGTVIVVVLVLVGFKCLLLYGMPRDFKLIDTQPDKYPWLEVEKITDLTSQFVSLGFKFCMDYTVDLGKPLPITPFGRVLVHPDHKCFVDIGQAQKISGMLDPIWYEIGSLFEGGLVFTVTHRKPNAEKWMTRRPKDAWVYCSDPSPDQLLKVHLQKRQELIDGCGLRVQDTLSVESIRECHQNDFREIRSVQRRKSIFVLLASLISFTIRPRYEWYGKLKKRS